MVSTFRANIAESLWARTRSSILLASEPTAASLSAKLSETGVTKMKARNLNFPPDIFVVESLKAGETWREMEGSPHSATRCAGSHFECIINCRKRLGVRLQRCGKVFVVPFLPRQPRTAAIAFPKAQTENASLTGGFPVAHSTLFG